MRKFAVITTFHQEGYELYGKNMIEGFEKYWPDNIPLYVYHEDEKPNIQSSRIFYYDLHKSCPGLVTFKERHKNNPLAHGINPKNLEIKKSKLNGFRWDAVRFANKTFSIFHATQNIDVDVIIWFDADTKTFDAVPEDFLENLIPKDVYLTYLGRIKKYSECGFVAYNIKHKWHKEFMTRWESLYKHDTIFDLDEWHDSYVFDKVRIWLEEEGKIKNHNLSSNHVGEGHPFINCDLGKYMDHLKGKRKMTGKSRRSDLRKKRKEDYWKR